MVRRLMPTAAEPSGFRPPIELTWDRSGDDFGRSPSSPAPEGPQQAEVAPGQPVPLALFDPADRPGRCGEAGRPNVVKATSAS